MGQINHPAENLRRNKLHFLALSKINLTNNVNEMIDIAILHGYRDMCRTLRGISACPKGATYKAFAIDYLKKEILTFLDGKVADFAYWHKEITLHLITVFAFRPFTVGQSQKWINMTLKYLYCLSTLNHEKKERLFQDCHIPIDSIVLKNAKKRYDIKMNTLWSKIDSYEAYLCFQQKLGQYARKEQMTLLQMDFALWNDGERAQS